jgi:hypothetical protein
LWERVRVRELIVDSHAPACPSAEGWEREYERKIALILSVRRLI